MRYLIVLIIFCSVPALASFWDANNRGEILHLHVTNESNYGFRVYLVDTPAMCGTTGTNSDWAYLNKADSNYETYVTLLTAAKFSQTEVTVFASADTNNFCKIGYLIVH